MRIVPLASVANQSFTVTIDGVRWIVAVKSTRGVMCVDMSRAGIEILTGIRALAGEPIIPYAYLQTGNFIFLTLDDALPDWRQFGVTQFLVYLSAIEIADIDPVTVGSFAPVSGSEFLTTDDGFYLTTDSGGLLTNG